jgi:hypothetical protein
MTQDPQPPDEPLYLLDQAARARRLARAISGDPMAAQLERLAEEFEAKLTHLVRPAVRPAGSP